VSAAGAPARFFSNFKSFEMPTLYRLNSQKVRQLFSFDGVRTVGLDLFDWANVL
jgi:hypothetical protein